MKRISKPISLLLAVLMAALLAAVPGCAGPQQQTDLQQPSDQGGGSQAQGAATGKVLKIGLVVPLTGGSARSGEEFKRATEMVFEDAGYMIGDYKVEIVLIDDGSDPDTGTRAYEQAIQQSGIDVGLCIWNSSVGSAVMEVLAKHKFPHFFSYSAAAIVNEKFHSDDKYTYMTTKSWATPSKLMSEAYVSTFQQAMESGTWDRARNKIFIYGEDNDWGRDFGASVGQGFKDIGWEIVGEEYFKSGDTDMYALLAKMRSSGAHVVAGSATTTPSVAALIKQSQEVNLTALMICDGLGYIGDWYDLTGDASDFILDSVPVFATPESKAFADRFRAKYNLEPSAACAGQQYDFTRFFIKVGEATIAEYGELTRESLYRFAREKLWTGQFTFTDGIIMDEIKYDANSIPDPVVGEGYYIFPVVQYFGGEPHAIWPHSQKEADLRLPD